MKISARFHVIGAQDIDRGFDTPRDSKQKMHSPPDISIAVV